VAAAGKLLGLSLDELENAQGIARTMTQPHDQAMYKDSTLMVRIHHGFVCQDSINACLLAKRGITGPRHEVLAAPRGYLGFAKWETDPNILTKDLAVEWEMLNTTMKIYAACKGTHTSISAVLDLMNKLDFRAEDIANIDLDESPINWPAVCEPKKIKWNPQTVIDCQFSLPYVVAAAAYDKHISLDSYTPHAMVRKHVRELMTRISAKKDPSLPPHAARANITLKDGRKFSKEYIYSKGHPNNPFTEHELIDKFRMCVRYAACQLSDEAVNLVIEALTNLEKVDDVVNALLIPLSPKIYIRPKNNVERG
jgi:2-methylcitrate dehydratase PrpD